MTPDVKAALAAMFASGEDPLTAAAVASKLAADATDAAVRRPPAMPFDVLTLEQAADYLQLPEDVVLAEAEAGRVVGQCIGGKWRFLRQEIMSWLRTPNARPLVSFPVSTETDEEFEKFQDSIRAYRDEIDRATGSGKYAPE